MVASVLVHLLVAYTCIGLANESCEIVTELARGAFRSNDWCVEHAPASEWCLGSLILQQETKRVASFCNSNWFRSPGRLDLWPKKSSWVSVLFSGRRSTDEEPKALHGHPTSPAPLHSKTSAQLVTDCSAIRSALVKVWLLSCGGGELKICT